MEGETPEERQENELQVLQAIYMEALFDHRTSDPWKVSDLHIFKVLFPVVFEISFGGLALFPALLRWTGVHFICV